MLSLFSHRATDSPACSGEDELTKFRLHRPRDAVVFSAYRLSDGHRDVR